MQNRWVYHTEGPYAQGSWHWGWQNDAAGLFHAPGPTYKVRYGEPVLVRRMNNLPPVGDPDVKVQFALPSITVHLHNGHTASESDGIPTDFFNSGEFWDHHYGNFPAGFDNNEIMNTLWYHDHRLDFTAPNVYAGLSGFYLLFDDLDSDDENDPNPDAFRLPSGDYDIPMILHDVQFDQNGQVVFDFLMVDWVRESSRKTPTRLTSAVPISPCSACSVTASPSTAPFRHGWMWKRANTVSACSMADHHGCISSVCVWNAPMARSAITIPV